MNIIIKENIICESISIMDLQNAIKEKNQVQISYQDLPGTRLIEPILLGKTIAGNLAIRAYQVSGPTKSRNNEWKIFLTDKIITMTPTDNEIEDNRRKLNKKGDQMFSEIILQNQE